MRSKSPAIYRLVFRTFVGTVAAIAWVGAEEAPQRAGLDWWAFQEVRRPKAPETHPGVGPIDAFVLERLEEHGMEPAPEAGRRALIRRVHYDLTGLPPSFDRIEAFVADKSPGAYEDLVDRLLASEHFGERWARHWLDVVRFAETNGYERDAVKPNLWKYRDWVIDAFNADMPYDQFVREQLAGDEIPARTARSVIATQCCTARQCGAKASISDASGPSGPS